MPEHFEIEDFILKKYTGPGGVVIVPDGVRELGGWAFYDNHNAEAVILPEGLMTIGQNAFNCCDVGMVGLPSSLRVIRDDAFQLCRSLFVCAKLSAETFLALDWERLTALYGVLELPWGFNTMEEAAFCGCPGIEKVTIPGSLREIPDCAFCDCAGLKTVIIRFGVRKIDRAAFARCPALTDVYIPESVTDIHEEAFFRPEPPAGGRSDITGKAPLIPGMVRLDTAHRRPQGLVISGVPGSAAEAYAKRKDIAFKEAVSEFNPKAVISEPCFYHHRGYCCIGISPAFLDSEELWAGPESYAWYPCPCGGDPHSEDCPNHNRLREQKP